MDDGLKQRLVGAVVLVAIGVLFIPTLFEQDSRRKVDLTTQIPPEPLDTPKPLVVPEPERPPGIEQAKALEEFYPHEEAVEETSPPANDNPPPVLNAEGVPNAWSIQVGSFQSEDRAEALERQLLEDGYTAYVRASALGDETRYRVFVGPKINREQALREKAKLEKVLKTETLLVRYQP